MMATGLPNGEYNLGGQTVYVRDNSARLADGTIASSLIMLDDAVRNAVKFGVPLQHAVAMASTVPALVCGVGDRKGKLAAGMDADIALLGPGLQVVGSLIAGKRV